MFGNTDKHSSGSMFDVSVVFKLQLNVYATVVVTRLHYCNTFMLKGYTWIYITAK